MPEHCAVLSLTLAFGGRAILYPYLDRTGQLVQEAWSWGHGYRKADPDGFSAGELVITIHSYGIQENRPHYSPGKSMRASPGGISAGELTPVVLTTQKSMPCW